MLKNYFKIAWRNLLKNKTSSFINISGLAVGMAVAILICLWIWDELSYNHYHQHHKRLALTMSVETINGATTAEPFASVPLASALRNAFPGDFKNMALAAQTYQLLKTGDKSIGQAGLWTQAGFPAMFTLKMLKGNLDALTDPSSIMLSQSSAKALFGDIDPINQTLLLNNKTAVKVGGVYEDIPDNSSFGQTQFLLAWDNKDNPGMQHSDDWIDHHFQLYVQLSDKASFDETSARIKNITRPKYKRSLGRNNASSNGQVVTVQQV